MCVPVPVGDNGQRNLNKNFKVTGGLPGPAASLVNQMTIPFRRAVTGRDVEEQQRKFQSPKTMAAMLAPPPRGTEWRGKPY